MAHNKIFSFLFYVFLWIISWIFFELNLLKKTSTTDGATFPTNNSRETETASRTWNTKAVKKLDWNIQTLRNAQHHVRLIQEVLLRVNFLDF